MGEVQIGRVAVIGAGIGGLACALHLAVFGLEVVVIERAPAPGGKMREIEIDGRRIDAGPTVFTMRWVFEQLFAAAGADLDRHLQLQRAEVLCRHAWSEDERLDLYADLERSASAIGEFAGAVQARCYLEFCARARRIFRTLEQPFLRADRPSPVQLVRRAGVQGLADLWRVQPFATLWDALGDHFHDPRLRQLFGRYATYCGSSPFLAPATLMLVAHVEQDGVWLVRGGMQRVATALANLCRARGVEFRYGVEAQEILAARGRVCGVRLAGGERIDTATVVVNADPAALAAGLFGAAVAPAAAPVSRARRSLSALTWTLVAATQGFPLVRHNVFFSDAYAAEFDDILRRRRLPRVPTVYVCAQDRDDGVGPVAGDERLLCLVNAPADGDAGDLDARELAACEAAAFARLERCGLTLRRHPERTVLTTPADFARLFPASGGALYGRASHGWQASFSRPGARTRVPGLYLCGGAAHPGPGVPMAALSGRLAALALIADLQRAARARSGNRAA